MYRLLRKLSSLLFFSRYLINNVEWIYWHVTYCTMLRLPDHIWPPVVPCFATEDAVRIVNSFNLQFYTRNYNHSQLFLTLCHIYTAYNHTRSWLQSLLTLLHWLTSQPSITHFTSSNFETLAEILLRKFTSQDSFLRLLLDNSLIELLLKNCLEKC
jgi:hypothetical protein